MTFPHPFCRQTSKKLKEDPSRKKIEKSLARCCLLRGKSGKTFWFSSPCQMVQFDTVKFCKAFKNYFGRFVWIEKIHKKVTIIVAFHFMKRRLKIEKRTQKRRCIIFRTKTIENNPKFKFLLKLSCLIFKSCRREITKRKIRNLQSLIAVQKASKMLYQ